MKMTFASFTSWIRNSLSRRAGLPLVSGAIVFAVAMVYFVYTIQIRSVQVQATEEAEAVIAQTLAIPPTTIHLISDRLNEQGLYRINFISPWPINPDNAPESTWEKEAIAMLLDNPQRKLAKRAEIEGESRLLHANAALASSVSCVSCHNDNPDSPKRDFRQGDLMGAMVVEIPLADALATARVQAVWTSLAVLAALACFVGFVLLFQRRAVIQPVEQLAQAAQKMAQGDLAVELEVRSEDEIGYMTRSFNQMAGQLRELYEALRESERKFRDIAKNIPGMVYQLRVRSDGSSYFSYASPRAGELFGLPDDLRSEEWELGSRVHPQDREPFFTSISQAIESFTDWNYTGRMLLSDGDVKWFQGMSSPTQVCDEIVFDGILLDITERKRAEEALMREKNISDGIIRSLPGIFYMYDEQRYLVRWNKKHEEVTGYSTEELAHKHMLDFFEGEDKALIASRVDKVFAEGEADAEADIVTKNGERIPYYFTGLRTTLEGKVHLVGLGIDITERKQTEAELSKYREHLEELVEVRTAELEEEIAERRRAEKAADEARIAAEAANRAKSTFLANMSHELRTPLNAVLGFSQIMHRDPETTEAQQENLGIIARSGEHLLTLINDILDISKIEAGRVFLEPENFDLDELIRDVTDMMRIRAEGKNLQLTLDQSSDFPRYIHCDPAKLRQILVNLIGNAIKYTEIGSITLRLNAKPEARERVRLFCEVQDTGIGIAQENLGRIFNPFEQAVRQTDVTGTGLGLAITRQYVELMGGETSVESELGQGSVFRFEIPVQTVPVEEIERIERQPSARGSVIGLEPDQHAPDGGPFRILIVEDRLENRLLLTKLLEPIGFEVREAVNGKDAISVFKEWRPHFIWMDRRMPVMDGLKATQRIRAIEEEKGGKETIIVALTASAFKEQRDEVLAAGSDDFVRKPFREEEIFEVMAQHLGVRYRYAEPVVDKEPATAAGIVLTSADMAVLPDDLLTELRQAAMSGHGELVLNFADRIAPDHARLAKGLKALAHEYRYDKLEELTRHGRDDEPDEIGEGYDA